jgi:hypothetical protein
MDGAFSAHRKVRNVYKRLVGKPERMKPLRISGTRWENCIEIEVEDCIDLAQGGDRLRAVVNTVMNLRVI